MQRKASDVTLKKKFVPHSVLPPASLPLPTRAILNMAYSLDSQRDICNAICDLLDGPETRICVHTNANAI